MVKFRDALSGANAVPLDKKPKGEDDLLLAEVAAVQCGLVGFGVRLFAERAAKTAHAVTMLAKALTINLAGCASHFGGVL